MNSLRHVLERPHRLLPGFALGEPEVSDLEQRDRRSEALGGASPEELLGLVQGDDSGETAFVAKAAE